MIDREQSLYHLLLSAARLTDWAAQDVVAIPLKPRKKNLRKLVEVVANLFEVRDELLRIRPDLAPQAIPEQASNRDAIELDNPMPQALQDYFELESAIAVLEGFASGHNRELAAVARDALPALRSKLQQLDSDARA